MPRSSAGSRISTARSSRPFSKDPLTASARSALMARVRQRDTEPEIVVRSILHRMGLRFTVSGPLNRTLPSRPDIVLPRWRIVILVHGCFWHRHAGCRLATTPTNRSDFWQQKFSANMRRDRRQQRRLRQAGWIPLVVWECQTRTPEKVEKKLRIYFARIQSLSARRRIRTRTSEQCEQRRVS